MISLSKPTKYFVTGRGSGIIFRQSVGYFHHFLSIQTEFINGYVAYVGYVGYISYIIKSSNSLQIDGICDSMI
jgi:hypothetical protein